MTWRVLFIALFLMPFLSTCQSGEGQSEPVIDSYNAEIIRDDYGIPHIYGKSDADAVFGMMYAQAEDDFPRIERNYVWAIGRLAEIEGESAIFSDLRARLYMSCLLYTSPSPRDLSTSRMPSSA